jgi:dUTP pyrophosphatase
MWVLGGISGAHGQADGRIELWNMVNVKVKKLVAAAQMPRYAHVGEFGDLAADLYASAGAVLAAAGND